MARRTKKDAGTVDFTGWADPPTAEDPDQPPVFIAPTASPSAAAYAAGIEARRVGRKSLPKTNTPVGGAPMPPVPHLGGEHQEGMTMAEQAGQQRYDKLIDAQNDPLTAINQSQTSVVQMPTSQELHPQNSSAGLGIRSSDTLPEEATKDANFRMGAGCMVASSQPHLAAKYGVVRNGRHVPPQQLQNPKPAGAPQRQLSQKSIEDLQQISELQKQQQSTDGAGLPKTQEESMNNLPDAAKAAAGDAKPLTQEEKAKVKERLEEMDEFQLATLRERMMKDAIQNDEQRKIIESRLEELKLDDLLLHNRIKQRVPIIPRKFEPTFQSVNAEEDLALKRLIMEESESIQASQQYFLDKYALMAVALGVFAVNGKPVGDHVDSNGRFSDELFLKKFNRISKWPTHMIASLGVNYAWFEERVRLLFVADAVGNG